MSDDVTIRPVTTVAELHAIEGLQREVWAMPDRDVVPAHHLLAASAAGGIVLGAFEPSGRLVGFCYGFVGLRGGRMLFYSHMAGVLERARGHEVGFRLKRAQREAALARGLDHMIWTYDPLVSANAHLNLRKLGARASRYYVDYYGEMRDELNRGGPSDRLEVDWWLGDPRVEALMRGEAPPLPEAERVRIEIPTTFDLIRRDDPALAESLRARTREAFLRHFAEGYEAVDFDRSTTAPMRVGAYILQRIPHERR